MSSASDRDSSSDQFGLQASILKALSIDLTSSSLAPSSSENEEYEDADDAKPCLAPINVSHNETEFPVNLSPTSRAAESETNGASKEQGTEAAVSEHKENGRKRPPRSLAYLHQEREQNNAMLCVDELPVVKRQSSERSAWMAKMATELEAKHKHTRAGKNQDKDRESDTASYTSTTTLNDTERKWLLTAVRCDYHMCAKILHRNPELVHSQDYVNGFTALHWAAKKGHMQLVKTLAGTYRADVNKRSNGGYTPLHLAYMYGHNDIVQLLCQTYNASQGVVDNSGRLPRSYANNAMKTRRVTARELMINGQFSVGSISRRGQLLSSSVSDHSVASSSSTSSLNSSDSGFARVGSIKKAGSVALSRLRLLTHRHSWTASELGLTDWNLRERKALSSSPGPEDRALMPPPKELPVKSGRRKTQR